MQSRPPVHRQDPPHQPHRRRGRRRAVVVTAGGEVIAETYSDGVDYRYANRSLRHLLGLPMVFSGEPRVTDTRTLSVQVTTRLATKSVVIQIGIVLLTFGLLLALLVSWVPASAGLITIACAFAVLPVAVACRYVWPRRMRQQLLYAVQRSGCVRDYNTVCINCRREVQCAGSARRQQY
mgnify:FL=1